MHKFVILLKNVNSHIINNAELFKYFVLVTHDHGEKLWCDNLVNSHVWRCEYGRQSLHPPKILVHLGNMEFMNHRTGLLNVPFTITKI